MAAAWRKSESACASIDPSQTSALDAGAAPNDGATAPFKPGHNVDAKPDALLARSKPPTGATTGSCDETEGQIEGDILLAE